MSSVPEANRYAPPSAHVEDVAAASDRPVLAGRWARLGGAIIDGLLAIGVFWLIQRFTPMGALVSSGAWSAWSALAAQALIGLLLFAVMHGWLLARHGQTIGKRIVGTRIVRSNGERASLARLLGLRYYIGGVVQLIPVAGAIYALVDMLLIFRESRQCLHDNIADTIVVVA
jgi:uncharacterized RDD family membrane protein YckC